MVTPVEAMRGIANETRLGGVVLKRGGIYGFDHELIWFDSAGIIQKDFFDYMVTGKIIDIYD